MSNDFDFGKPADVSARMSMGVAVAIISIFGLLILASCSALGWVVWSKYQDQQQKEIAKAKKNAPKELVLADGPSASEKQLKAEQERKDREREERRGREVVVPRPQQENGSERRGEDRSEQRKLGEYA